MSSREDEIGAALRDYALDQLAHADLQVARAGAWQHDGVHSARKAIARVRACVELLHKSPVAQRALERRLRSFAHGLSTMRDAQAVLATAKRMHKVDDTSGKAWRELARTLKQRRDRILGAALAHDAGFAMRRSRLAEVRAALSRVAWTRLRTAEL